MTFSARLTSLPIVVATLLYASSLPSLALAQATSARTPAASPAPRLNWSSPAPGKQYTLMPSPKTVVYGAYDGLATPALRIASGDEVDVGAVSTCGARLLRPNTDTGTVEPAYRAIQATRDTSIMKRGPGGHILTGPIYIEGAEPGDVIEIRIKSIDLAIPFACNSAAGFMKDEFRGGGSKIVPLDKARMIGTFADGIEIPLAPFFGSMGVAPPPDSGRLNSAPPGMHAGNLDNKELVAGTALYIPVFVKGAMFEIGDGHAGQGNGEVDITALETALRGHLQFVVHKDMKLTWPRGETPTHWIAMGTDKDLTTATKIAIREAIKLLGDLHGMTPTDAYMLISTACDVSVTQLVDGNMGMHVMIPKRLFVK